MGTWNVAWEVTVEADTAEEAARAAANVLCVADPHRQVYKAWQSWADPVQIDLAEAHGTQP